MRRRDFFAMLSGVPVLPPVAAWAQAGLPLVGYINAASKDSSAELVGAFKQGLSEAGYVEGRNVAIEYRWARAITTGCRHWPPTLSAIGLRCDCRYEHSRRFSSKGGDGNNPHRLHHRGDPVKLGLVSRLSRPDG